jgi:sorbose reductase
MGTFFSAQLAAKHMASQGTGGSIVMIASVASHCAIPSQRLAMYGASKGSVRILAKHLAVEMAPNNIRVNTISPGYIATDMTKSLELKDPELLSTFQSAAPMKRMGDPKDLKGITAYLLTDAAAYTTGADIEVTGGLHAGRI